MGTPRFWWALCGYCAAALKLLDDKGVAYEEIDATMSATLRREMMERSGQSTFPQIFIDNESIGGYDNLAALDHEGQLDGLLGLDG